MDDNELARVITTHAAELEALINPILADYFQREQDSGESSPTIAICSLHMVLCCLMAKAYAMAVGPSPSQDVYAGFMQSLVSGVEHFIAIQMKLVPKIQVEQLLRELNERIAAKKKKQEQGGE